MPARSPRIPSATSEVRTPSASLRPDDWAEGDDETDAPFSTGLPGTMPGQTSSVVTVREDAVTASDHGKRLDRLLADWIPEHSRSHLKTLIEEGAVTVHGEVALSASRKVQAGQRVRIEVRPTAQSQAFSPEAMALDVVFEDDHVLVLNKPAGLVVHPAAGHWSGTLMNGLLAHHASAMQLPRAGIVHRLDKDTSGLMVVAKSWEAMHALTQAIAARTVSRQYLALVHGVCATPRRVDVPLGRDPVSRVRMAVGPHGKPACTDVISLGSGLLLPDAMEVSAVRCVLHTGRTHQIRVHMAHLGHPLLADTLYGGRVVDGLTRQALHAARLAFQHPITGYPLCFTAPCPADVASLYGRLGWAMPDFSSWVTSGA